MSIFKKSKNFKYKKGQEAVLTNDARMNSILVDSMWGELIVREIEELYCDDSIPEYGEKKRYRLGGLWFNEEELMLVSKETHPEYYL